MKRLILFLLLSASSFSFSQSSQDDTEKDSLSKHFNELLASNCLKPYPLCWWDYSEYVEDWEVDTSSADSIPTTIFVDTFGLQVGPYDPWIITPQPPPIIIGWEDWDWGSIVFTFLIPERPTGRAERIFSYHESEDICLEVLQIGKQFNIKIHSLEKQIISFHLKVIAEKKILGYQHISIPLAFREGTYEWNASPAFIAQQTYLLEVVSNSLSETIRISSENDLSGYACQVRADAINTYNKMNNIERYQLCVQDEIF